MANIDHNLGLAIQDITLLNIVATTLKNYRRESLR